MCFLKSYVRIHSIVSSTTKHYLRRKKHIVKTISNQQNKQNGRKSLGLASLVRSAGTLSPAANAQAFNAQLPAAALYLALTPAYPELRDGLVELERGISARHSDWTYSIRGDHPPCRYG